MRFFSDGSVCRPDDAAEGAGSSRSPAPNPLKPPLRTHVNGTTIGCAKCFQAGIMKTQAKKLVRGHVSASGRLSLPAEFRKAVGLEHGGDVVVELDNRE